jgi:hypothetical protein
MNVLLETCTFLWLALNPDQQLGALGASRIW